MKLIEDIKPLAKQLITLHQEAYRQYFPKVNALIENKIKDDNNIQRLLDELLDFCGEEQILLLFKKLCRYYLNINPQATADYINFYRETYDDENNDK